MNWGSEETRGSFFVWEKKVDVNTVVTWHVGLPAEGRVLHYVQDDGREE